MEKQCQHEEFAVLSKVGRITEVEGGPVTSYMLEMKLQCNQCKMFFEFVGLPAGYSPDEPCTSFDFTEVRMPVRPFSGEVATSLHYQVKPTETDKKPN